MVTLNIYVIHYNKLNNRLLNIERLRDLAKAETMITINIKIIDEHQPETINVNNIKNLVKLEKLPEEENQFYQKFMKQLSKEILSNIFHHFKAIQMISKHSNNEYGMILEDDVMYSERIFTQITTLLNHIKSVEWDIIFLGQPSDRSIQNMTNLSLTDINNENVLLHCCESYLLNSTTAKDILLNFFPVRFVYNIHLSYLINKHNYKCYKIFPNICGDGSKMGDYTSSIMMNNVLIFNDVYKDIYLSLENTSVFDEIQIESIKKKFKSNPRKENADFSYLEGLFYKKIGDLDKSMELFEQAMYLYDKDSTPMNNTSTFLKNYIELYKNKQII